MLGSGAAEADGFADGVADGVGDAPLSAAAPEAVSLPALALPLSDGLSFNGGDCDFTSSSGNISSLIEPGRISPTAV